MTRLWYLRYVSALFLLIFISCKSEYEKLEERELSSGKKVDELFLGLKLGMDKKDFYQACWELNSQGLLINGPNQLSVEYKPKMPSGNEAKMMFYPEFEENKIFLMPLEFQYLAWSPLNGEFSAENLQKDVVALFEEWYGPGFIEVANEDKSKIAWVKMDGNRRIRVFKKNLSTIRAEISDLPMQKKLSQKES